MKYSPVNLCNLEGKLQMHMQQGQPQNNRAL